VECGQTTLWFGLLCLSFRVCFNGIHTHLIGIHSLAIGWGSLVPLLPIPSLLSLGYAASAKGIKAPAKEEHDPRRESHPNSTSDFGRTHSVYPCSCDEEQSNIEDEGQESNAGSETGYASAAAGHGHFTNVCEKAKHS
jgi:hypothetical protein